MRCKIFIFAKVHIGEPANAQTGKIHPPASFVKKWHLDIRGPKIIVIRNRANGPVPIDLGALLNYL
jgi:hypothetical protein